MPRVQSRVVRKIRLANLHRVTRVLGRSSIVLSDQRWVHRLGDLQRKATSEALGGTLHGVRPSIRRERFFALHAQVEGAVAACSAHHFLWCDCAVGSDVAGADAGFVVAEEEALEGWVSTMSREYRLGV